MTAGLFDFVDEPYLNNYYWQLKELEKEQRALALMTKTAARKAIRAHHKTKKLLEQTAEKLEQMNEQIQSFKPRRN